MKYNTTLDDFDDDFDYGDGDDEDDMFNPCSRCGPECPEWGGDGLCMIEINQQAQEFDHYFELFPVTDVFCPICGVKLPCYSVPESELWSWSEFSPLIGLEVYSAHSVPKGEHHRDGNLVHIWIGSQSEEGRLIRLLGKHTLCPPTRPQEGARNTVPFCETVVIPGDIPF